MFGENLKLGSGLKMSVNSSDAKGQLSRLFLKNNEVINGLGKALMGKQKWLHNC